MLVHDLADLWAGALPGLPGTPQEELVGPPSRGSLTLGCHSSLRLRGDGCQCDSVGQPVRPLPSAGACPGCGRRWPPGAARGPAHRALGETQPCRPSALGRRGRSTARCPSWGSPHCRCREKGQAPIKQPSAAALAPPCSPFALCASLSVPGLCLSVSGLLAGAVLEAPAVAGHAGSQAPGVSTDRLSPALPLKPRILLL